MNNGNIKDLTSAITLQAVRDYFSKGATPKKRRKILRELRSTWMDFITDGMSVIVAEQLELHPDEIAERLRLNHEIN